MKKLYDKFTKEVLKVSEEIYKEAKSDYWKQRYEPIEEEYRKDEL